LYYLKNLDPEYIAKSIYGLIEGNYTSVDTKKVALLYSWDARVKEIQKVYEFARKNYLV